MSNSSDAYKKEKICPLCKSKNIDTTNFKLRDSDNLNVLYCRECSLHFLSSFEHIKKDFYDTTNMAHIMKTPQQWLIDSSNDNLRRYKFLKNIIKNKKYLDFGCGACGMLLLSKNIAKVYGVEKCIDLQEFYKKNNLKVFYDIDEIKEQFDVITMFHVLEHLAEPKKELQKILNHLKPDGKIFIEVPNSSDALISLYKCRSFINFTHWSCHLYSYNKKSLRILFNQIPDIKINYIKNISRFGFANHMYWILKHQKGGQKIWKHLNFLDIFYKPLLKIFNKGDTLLCCITKK